MTFKSLILPESLEYSSDGEHLPVEFYLNAFPQSKEIFLKLGYFSSTAIRTLSLGFAQFIYNGGVLNIVSNHYLYRQDHELLEFDSFTIKEAPINDLAELSKTLTASDQHFYNCLKYLVKLGRLNICPVMLKGNRMAHYKQGVFVDGDNNEIFIEGSCNFTSNGLLENGEHLSVFRSWGGVYEKRKCKGKKEDISSILNKQAEGYSYLTVNDILNAAETLGAEKSLQDLLIDECNLFNSIALNRKYKSVFNAHSKRLSQLIEIEKLKPSFPYPQGPRGYQQDAYKKWVENGKSGIFSMATGTGKTITALNCVLQEFKEAELYRALILVPSDALVNQWEVEVKTFNFSNIIKVHSKNSKWKEQLSELRTGLMFEQKKSFIIIATYRSLENNSFSKSMKELPSDTIFIADEAHNIASKSLKPQLPEIHFNYRIGLSATLKRYFDPEGDAAIETFFKSSPPYTYSFDMERAILEGVLCPYYYYPHCIYLTDEELKEYTEISAQLAKFFDSETGQIKMNSASEALLLKRKRIIHKATGKLAEFRKILQQSKMNNQSLNYTFVYTPEGLDGEGDNILSSYLGEYEKVFPYGKAFDYTSQTQNKSLVMEKFESGFINTIFSMKCLDEGVDIPRTEMAIFCSSTGNPRQYIQRRGRVLRQHKDKDFAVVHDLIVAPMPVTTNSFFEPTKIETKIMRDELERVVYFASLATNYAEAIETLQPIANKFKLDLYEIETNLREKNAI